MPPTDPTCSITPGTVSLGESFTVNAEGLPHNGVYLIVAHDDWASTGPISTPDGTFQLTISSDDLYPSGQTGEFTYHFVSKVRWPQGTFQKEYTSCSVTIS